AEARGSGVFSREAAAGPGRPRRHLGPAANPARMALFDLSSSWLEGSQCPLADRGYSRDGKEGEVQIEEGLLTDPEGRPVAVRVFPGNTGDPAAFTAIADVLRDKFGLAKMVMVGDRGMITSARIAALNQQEDGTPRPDRYGWITALRAPAVKKLMAEDGPLQLSLFDEQDLAEITSPDFPGERLGARRNPALAARAVASPHPGSGRRTGPQARGPAGRDRETARPRHRPGPGRPARGRGGDRGRGGPGDRQVQDRQALPPRHHRPQPGYQAQARTDRRRGRPGRVLRAANPRPRRRTRRARRGHGLQESRPRRTGLPLDQVRRP